MPHNGNRAEFAVSEIFYCHDVFTESGALILHKKLRCLSHLISSLRQTVHILGTKENINWLNEGTVE